MITGFFLLVTWLVYLGIAGVVLWLASRFVTAHERMASAQERSADALADIARKPGSET
jgi:hypothetical protein